MSGKFNWQANPYINCPDCGFEYHVTLEFCPKCKVFGSKGEEPHSTKGEDSHGFTDINARLAMDYIEMKRCDEPGWAEDCKEAANTITILREENKQLRENK